MGLALALILAAVAGISIAGKKPGAKGKPAPAPIPTSPPDSFGTVRDVYRGFTVDYDRDDQGQTQATTADAVGAVIEALGASLAQAQAAIRQKIDAAIAGGASPPVAGGGAPLRLPPNAFAVRK